jgi:hypothetical protein
MLCGCSCNSRLTPSQVRAHFTICAKRPAVSPPVNHRDERSRNWKAKRGRPPRQRGCAAGAAGPDSRRVRYGRTSPTGRHTRAHFTICAKWPAASEHWDRRGRGGRKPAKVLEALRMPCRALRFSGCFLQDERDSLCGSNAVQLALRRPTHGEPDAGACHQDRSRQRHSRPFPATAKSVSSNSSMALSTNHCRCT